jgi:peptidoglycan/xylan/chitin deacetylase (PgdA/CDA1 family)
MTPVFYYHRVGPFREGAPRKGNVSPENFRKQMRFLRDWAADALTLDQVLAGRPGAAVTFDDGFKDVMEYALPVLREYRVSATFFLVAGRVGGTDAWMRVTSMPEERLLDWDDAKRLIDAGHEVGSHTLTHGVLTEEEVRGSRELLEQKLGVPVRHFAYPRGEHPPEGVEFVRRAGYVSGWATQQGGADPFTRRRLSVSANTGLFHFGKKMLQARIGLR